MEKIRIFIRKMKIIKINFEILIVLCIEFVATRERQDAFSYAAKCSDGARFPAIQENQIGEHSCRRYC